jgi:hypothetical protein
MKLTGHPAEELEPAGEKFLKGDRLFPAEEQRRDLDEGGLEGVLLGRDDPVELGVAVVVKNDDA